jgi:hypothetical protein
MFDAYSNEELIDSYNKSFDTGIVGAHEHGETQKQRVHIMKNTRITHISFSYSEDIVPLNYLLVMEDKREGIHNPAYDKALIRNSVEALD